MLADQEVIVERDQQLLHDVFGVSIVSNILVFVYLNCIITKYNQGG